MERCEVTKFDWRTVPWNHEELPIGGGIGPWCDECGLDLSMSQEQMWHIEKYGNPLPRPPCPGNTESGMHRCRDIRASKARGAPS